MSVATRVTSTERVTSICRLYDHTRLLSLSAIGHGQRTIYILSASTVGHGQRKIHRVTLGIGYRTRPKDNTEGYSRHQQSDTVKGQYIYSRRQQSDMVKGKYTGSLSASAIGHGQRTIQRVTLGISNRTRSKDNTQGHSRHQQSDTVKGQYTELLSASAIGHGQRTIYRVTLGISNRTRSKDNDLKTIRGALNIHHCMF